MTIYAGEDPVRFLGIEAVGATVCVLAILASGVTADRVGRRAVLGVSAVLIGAYSGFAPQLLGAGGFGEAIYMLGGFVLLGSPLASRRGWSTIASRHSIATPRQRSSPTPRG